ncbi:MAG: nickel pincer cofactor biosynthesis protein LarC [Nitrospirae bacterium]|nr:nickel pincer cofactor biosynthesis protein LarC [Nitrospirota bacterium]
MIAYFNCTSGISGDMVLGALVDAGVPLEKLKKELSKLPVRGYELKAKKVKRAGVRATKVDVVIKSEVRSQRSEVRRWKDIEKIITTSKLSAGIKQKGLLIFKRLFEAEARVHGERIQDVHLHELGAVDCIVDIFGCLIGLDILGVDEVYSSPLNLGSGTIKTEHGILPVPAPATVELLKGKPVYSSDVLFELTTPTGAVLISSLAKGFGRIPQMNISKTGTGAGGKEFKGQPNVLTMMVGKNVKNLPSPLFAKEGNIMSPSLKKGDAGGFSDENITVIETNIDDMNPQVYEYVMERLFKAGALDVFLTQIIMKKGRPGIKLSVLCNESDKEQLIDIVLNETTSIGVRFYRADRRVLKREIRSVKTKFGTVNIKISQLGNKKQKASVEYEDCRKIAKKFNLPLLEVINEGTKEQRSKGTKLR